MNLDALNNLPDFAEIMRQMYETPVKVQVKGHDIEDAPVQVMTLREARILKYNLHTEWWNAGYQRRYINSRHNGRSLDQELFVRGKKHAEWRRIYITYPDGGGE